MMSRANLLILDEPTNHLDLASREWIEEAVAQFEGALLFVSHDRYFVRRFASRVWEIEDGAFRDYPCDYERYRRIKSLEREPAPAPEKPAKKTPQKSPARDQKAERRLSALEREIARMEKDLAAFDARIEECASDYEALNEILKQKAAAREALEGMYEQWEKAASAAEGDGD
jgi:ABC-type multidrug transport system ATPase subunit